MGGPEQRVNHEDAQTVLMNSPPMVPVCEPDGQGRNFESVAELQRYLQRHFRRRQGPFAMSGELGAEVELHRLFPGLPMEAARWCAVIVVSWHPPEERKTDGHGRS